MEQGRLRLATGITVPHRVHGDRDGLPCLLLHAWCESGAAFDRVLPLLPSWVRVHTIDLRGHGGADKPDVGYGLHDAAGDVVAVLDALGLRDAVLVGSSSGGYVAHDVAVTAPDRVRGLAMVGSPYSLAGRPAFAEEVERLRDPVDPAWVRSSLTWFPLETAVPPEYVDARVADALTVPAAIWWATLEGLFTAIPPSHRGTVEMPALVMWGERDGVLSRADQERLVEALPGARFVAVPDAGHLLLWEQPHRVAAEVVTLLAAIAGRGEPGH